MISLLPLCNPLLPFFLRHTSSGTQFLDAKIDFLVRACSHEDLRRIVRFRELDTGYGYGRGAGVPEDRFSGGEFADLIKGLGGGHPRLGLESSVYCFSIIVRTVCERRVWDIPLNFNVPRSVSRHFTVR